MEAARPAKNFYSLPKVAPKAQPFFIKAKGNNDTLIILVHGFSASPYYLHRLADFLAQRGSDVEVVLLAGHGSDFDELKNTTHLDWYRSLERVYLKFANSYQNIFVLGESFGANLAINLAHHYPQIRGVIAINAAIFIRKELAIRIALPFARIFMKKYKKAWHYVADLPHVKEAGRHIFIPIKSIVHFYHFIDHFTKKTVGQIAVPILIIHSRNDAVSSSRSSQWLYKRWSNPDKQIFIINKAKHGFGLLNESRYDFAFNKISNFVARHIS
ncbi:MAG: alpha/beta fold hydrolase [Patescibacteria group bacterium]